MTTADIQHALADKLTTIQAAKRLERTPRLIQNLCVRGAFPGAIRVGRDWYIPRAEVTARKRRQKTGLPKGGRGVKAYSDR
jgi:hypothetical protein